MAKQSKDDSAYGALSALRRHFNVCGRCRGSFGAGVFEGMCESGKTLTVGAAMKFMGVMDGKMALNGRGERIVYACPDISVHGAAYSLVAEPITVSGVQPGLF